VLFERSHVSIGQSLAGRVIAASAKVKLGGLEGHTGTSSDSVDGLEGNVGNLRANAVATDYCDFVFTSHVAAPKQLIDVNFTLM
jgi:hypothetical protein